LTHYLVEAEPEESVRTKGQEVRLRFNPGKGMIAD
jgi:hypothetical protein